MSALCVLRYITHAQAAQPEARQHSGGRHHHSPRRAADKHAHEPAQAAEKVGPRVARQSYRPGFVKAHSELCRAEAGRTGKAGGKKEKGGGERDGGGGMA